MLLDLGEKLEIIELYKLGNLEKAIKMLVKLNNKGYENILDRHFIYKTLTLLYKKIEDKKLINERDYTIVKYYSNKTMENIKYNKLGNEDQYYEAMWTNIGINEDVLSNNIIREKYLEIKQYYDSIGYVRNSVALQVNISKLDKDYNTIMDMLIEVILHEDDIEFCGMESDILQDIKNIFGDTYLELSIKKINDKRNGINIA